MLIGESLSRDFLRLIVWYPLRWLISVLPVRWCYIIFDFMGDMHSIFAIGRKECIRKTLCEVFPGRSKKEIRTAVRFYFRNHYVNQMQVFLFPRFTAASITKAHSFKGLEHLDKALSRGKGCVIIHPHFGPTQLPLCHIGLLGYSVMQLGLPSDEGLSYIGKNVAFRLRMKYEAAIPARIISADSFLRPVIECLRNNGTLMTTGDGAGGGKFIGKFMLINFLGRRMYFPLGAGTLAYNTGAVLLPMFTLRRDDGGYESVIHPAIERELCGKEDSVKFYTYSFAEKMEGYIKRQPYLWHFWDEWPDRLEKESDKWKKQDGS